MRLNATKLGSIANSRSFGDQLFDLAGQVPNLDLNFAGTKTLDPRITFTRASTGTYVGADGLVKTATTNEARFDHNPTTGESLGLLVEEARTNSTLYSQDFGNVAIGKNNATVTDNTATSPAGDSTADKLVEDSANSEHGVTLPNFSYAASTAYTFTIFAKAVERNRLRVLLPESAFGQNKVAWFDLNNGSVIQTSGTGITSSVSAYTNGWYRCAISATTTTAIAGTAAQLRLVNSGTTVTYTGDNTSGLLFWGAQLEVGAFPSSYIPTTTATATRAADVANITGTNFSPWYNQTEGTVFAEWVKNGSSNFQAMATISDGTTNNVIALAHGSGAPTNNTRFDINVSGSSQASLTLITGSIVGTKYLTTGAYKVNDFAAVANGGTPLTDATGTIPTTSQLVVGANGAGNGGFFNGTIRRLTYWPVRLANTTLVSITTP